MKMLFVLGGCMLLMGLSSCIAPFFATPPVYYRYAAPLIDTIKTRSVDVAALEKQYPNSGGVYLGVEAYIEPVLGNEIKYRCQSIYATRYVVLNPDDDEFSTFSIPIGKEEKLNAADIIVIQPDGSKKQYTQKDFLLERNSKYVSTMKFAIPGIKKGTIVDAAYNVYSISGDYSSYYRPLPLAFNEPCLYLRYEVLDRSDFTAAIKIDDKEMIKQVQGGYLPSGASAHVYKATNIPARKDEAYASIESEKAKEMAFDFYDRYTTPEYFWSTMGAFLTYHMFSGEYLNGYYSTSSTSYNEILVNKFRDSCTNDKQISYEKLCAIHNAMRKKLRPQYTERDAIHMENLVKRGVGTSHQIAEFLRRVCKSAGIKAELYVAHSAQSGEFNSLYLDFDQLTIPVVVCTIDSMKYTIFPDYPEYPPTVIPRHLLGQKTLYVDVGANYNYYSYYRSPYSSYKAASFSNLPDTSAERSRDKHEMNVHIKDDGSMEIEESRSFSGEDAASIRSRMRGMSSVNREKYITDWQSYTEGAQSLVPPVVENIDSLQKPLVFRYKYTTPNLVAIRGNNALVNVRSLLFSLTTIPRRIDSVRTSAIRIYDNDQTERIVRITTPSNWKLDKLPPPHTTETMMGKIESSYSQNANEITASFVQIYKSGSYPATATKELQKMIDHELAFGQPFLLFTRN